MSGSVFVAVGWSAASGTAVAYPIDSKFISRRAGPGCWSIRLWPQRPPARPPEQYSATANGPRHMARPVCCCS